jgi:flagellin
MARINTNVSALIAQRGLQQSESSLQTSLQRLSTGLRINSGGDDPAGLIASQGLQSEIAGINSAISNSTQATNVISTADGALSEVSSLLQTIKGLVVESANTGALSPTEIAANQLEVDSAVQSITRIANTTTFDGLQLINGNLDYVTSGVNSNAIQGLTISQAKLGTAPTLPVDINVITSAKPAQLEFRTSAVAHTVTLDISGNGGVQTLTFTSGTTASAIAFAINGISNSTGVSASLLDNAHAASGIVLSSQTYGSQSFVSITAQAGGGTFATTDDSGNSKQRAVGQDVRATINGALTVGSGLNISLNTSSLNLNLTLNKTFGAGQTDFTITGGGALFQLGSSVVSSQQTSIGIQSVAASQLGNSSIGFLNDVVTGGSATLVAGNTTAANNIVDAAISQVAVLRGQLGAFESNTLQTNINSLNVALENVTSSDSTIDDADFASETSNLTRAQILTQAGTSVLATANSTPQTILKLLQ